MTAVSPPSPLDDGERDELARLRREVADLRAGRPAGREPAPWRHRLRWPATAVLVLAASLLAPVTLVARYVDTDLLDTDSYVDTVAPLGGDPAVQEAVADIVTAELVERLDAAGLARDGLGALVEQGAPPQVLALATPIGDQVDAFARRQVGAVVASPWFADAWVRANRVAHAEVTALLTGETGALVRSDDGRVALDLGAVVDRVRQRLVDAGFDRAALAPGIEAELTIVESDGLGAAQRATRRLDTAATALPAVVLAAGGAAVAVAPDRRRALVLVVVGVTVGVAALALGLALARAWYLDHGAPERLPAATVVAIGDALLAPLRTAMRASLAMGATAAVVLAVAGPSPAAVRLRAAAGRLADRAGAYVAGARPAEGGERARRWVAGNAGALRPAVALAGAVVLVAWPEPDVTGALAVASVTGLAVLAIGRMAGRSPGGSAAGGG